MKVLINKMKPNLFVVDILCVLQQDAENFKKLNVISQDEFDTLTPKVPVDHNQEVPALPMPGGIDSSRLLG